ncbi:hypothetical protein BKA70DRAFT_1408332 [Coprinopsis sp. MPI-PUGE-AT-0042]|nr:hypothetical protein BKA70DRAFT_1408332 [Coprinopsis sp. MPI-PUGE-AT-0042]
MGTYRECWVIVQEVHLGGKAAAGQMFHTRTSEMHPVGIDSRQASCNPIALEVDQLVVHHGLIMTAARISTGTLILADRFEQTRAGLKASVLNQGSTPIWPFIFSRLCLCTIPSAKNATGSTCDPISYNNSSVNKDKKCGWTSTDKPAVQAVHLHHDLIGIAPPLQLGCNQAPKPARSRPHLLLLHHSLFVRTKHKCEARCLRERLAQKGFPKKPRKNCTRSHTQIASAKGTTTFGYRGRLSESWIISLLQYPSTLRLPPNATVVTDKRYQAEPQGVQMYTNFWKTFWEALHVFSRGNAGSQARLSDFSEALLRQPLCRAHRAHYCLVRTNKGLLRKRSSETERAGSGAWDAIIYCLAVDLGNYSD